jgi:hypothetical protein
MSSIEVPHLTIDQVIENICRRGCRFANQVIAQLDRGWGPFIPELAGLTDRERSAVLDELVEIMSVYAARDHSVFGIVKHDGSWPLNPEHRVRDSRSR